MILIMNSMIRSVVLAGILLNNLIKILQIFKFLGMVESKIARLKILKHLAQNICCFMGIKVTTLLASIVVYTIIYIN